MVVLSLVLHRYHTVGSELGTGQSLAKVMAEKDDRC